MFEFRNKGMNGTPEECEHFLKSIFHGVRFNERLAILAAPSLGKTQKRRSIPSPRALRVVTIIDSALIKIIDGLSSKRRAA